LQVELPGTCKPGFSYTFDCDRRSLLVGKKIIYYTINQ